MSDKYLQFLTATYIPLFNKVTEQQKAGILRSISDISPYCKGEEARALLPSVFKLLLVYLRMYLRDITIGIYSSEGFT